MIRQNEAPTPLTPPNTLQHLHGFWDGGVGRLDAGRDTDDASCEAFYAYVAVPQPFKAIPEREFLPICILVSHIYSRSGMKKRHQRHHNPSVPACSSAGTSWDSTKRNWPCLVARGPDVLGVFDAVVFNFLIGNGDAHGKNFSFLHELGQSRLAPLYDLVRIQAFPHLDSQMAMKIGDERDPGKVRQKDWLKFFKEAQVGPAQAIRRMTDLAKRVQTSASAWAALHPEDAVVTSRIGQNCTQILSLH